MQRPSSKIWPVKWKDVATSNKSVSNDDMTTIDMGNKRKSESDTSVPTKRLRLHENSHDIQDTNGNIPIVEETNEMIEIPTIATERDAKTEQVSELIH